MGVFTLTAGESKGNQRYWMEPSGALRCETKGLVKAFTLFGWHRRMRIDPERQVVQFETLAAWFFKSRHKVDFADIEYVDIQYTETQTRHYTIEEFEVSLMLNRNLPSVGSFRLPLFSWSGSTSRGLLLSIGENVEAPAKRFAQAVAEVIGTTVGPAPKHLADASGTKYVCSACGRNVPPTPGKPCMYCNGRIVPLQADGTPAPPPMPGAAPIAPEPEPAVPAGPPPSPTGKYQCAECGRPVHPNQAAKGCMYCGGPAVPASE